MRNRVLVVTIDGWGTNLLGTYGVPICETPALDDFASHSIVFDRFLCNSTEPLAVLRAITDGVHPSLSVDNNPNGGDLHHWVASTNRRSILITDCAEVSETVWADQFSESLLIDPASLVKGLPGGPNQVEEHQTVEQHSDDDAWMETGLAQFIGEALAELADRQNDSDGLPDVVWLHLSGLTSSWDAPYQYRLALCDEDDPRPSFSSEPVAFDVDANTDLDEVFQAMCAAAGQARLIDHLWSWIDAFVDQLPERDKMAIVLAGVRGYPLGEHSQVGLQIDSDKDESSVSVAVPHAERVHVPLIIQPGFMDLGCRVSRVTQPVSVHRFLEEWLVESDVLQTASDSNEAHSISATNRFELLFDDGSQENETGWLLSSTCEAIYTSSWAAMFDPISGEVSELYLMPDDRWQQNNIQNRAPEIVAAMSDLRLQWLQWRTDSLAQATTNLPQPIPEKCLNESV